MAGLGDKRYEMMLNSTGHWLVFEEERGTGKERGGRGPGRGGIRGGGGREAKVKDGFANKTKLGPSKCLLPLPHLLVLLISGNLILQDKSSVLSSEDQELILKMNISL